jgi:hypothetical protein
MTRSGLRPLLAMSTVAGEAVAALHRDPPATAAHVRELPAAGPFSHIVLVAVRSPRRIFHDIDVRGRVRGAKDPAVSAFPRAPTAAMGAFQAG